MSAIALITDLIFATKIKSTADEVGIPLSIVQSPEALEAAAAAGLNFAIIDLNAEGIDPIRAIRRCKDASVQHVDQTATSPDETSARPMVIAFGAHVQKDLIQAAEQAGADLVLPRSRFSAELPDLFAQYGQMRDRR